MFLHEQTIFSVLAALCISIRNPALPFLVASYNDPSGKMYPLWSGVVDTVLLLLGWECDFALSGCDCTASSALVEF